MTLFREAAAAEGERRAGAPGGARRHLPRPAALAALAPPREAAPPSIRGLWPPGYKGAAVRPQLGWGDSLPSEGLPPRGLPPDHLLCFATLPPGTTRGRAHRTSGWRRDAGLTGHGSLSYPQPPAPSDGTPCPNGLWRPARLRRRRHDPGTTAPHLPECRLKGGPCAPLGTDPSGRLQDQRGAAALKLSPCHARPWATVLSFGWDPTPVHSQSPTFTLAKTEQLCQEHQQQTLSVHADKRSNHENHGKSALEPTRVSGTRVTAHRGASQLSGGSETPDPP